MKNSTLVKFSLTLVCAAVLSACGSSGGGSNNNTASEVTPEVTPEVPEVTPEETTTDGTEGVTNVTEDTVSALSYGHKSVKKRDSNLNVGFGKEESSKSSLVQTAMTIPLDPSLDTIVVATGNFQDSTQAAYLEDFDFRGNTDNTTGVHKLDHIYVTGNGVTAGAGKPRAEHHEIVKDENENDVIKYNPSRTKTGLKGDQDGNALVFQNGRYVYISTDETEIAKEKIRNQALNKNDLRNRNATVAEVYGNRTFLEGNSELAQPTDSIVPNSVVTVIDTDGNESKKVLDNAPFLHKDANGDYVVAGKLDIVQYGRVTTKLDERKMSDFAEGVTVVDSNNTKVASFGRYGENGTEDHYFYRSNTGTRGALDTDALATHYKSGTVSYNGHAVTYGLDHSFKATNGIPNALGYNKELVSGTHVTADIDLANKTVTGRLYDVWSHGAFGSVAPQDNDLVKFDGTLNAANGAIVGTSTNLKNGSEGTLNANVFGSVAQELGGAVKSKSSEADASWGAVFGAAAVQPVNVVIPSNGGVSEGIDGENSKAN